MSEGAEGLTLAGAGEAELRVEGSRFLALAQPIAGEEEARALLEERRRRFHDATHHCSAWKVGSEVRRSHDDGEPGGSAGAPILAAIEGAGLSDCAVVVTRYFGGTKLGVGGLIRAYGGAAAAALEAAPRRRVLPGVRIRIRYAFPHTGTVMSLLERSAAEQVEHGYAGERGELTCALPAAELPGLGARLREQTAGALEPEELGPVRLFVDL